MTKKVSKVNVEVKKSEPIQKDLSDIQNEVKSGYIETKTYAQKIDELERKRIQDSGFQLVNSYPNDIDTFYHGQEIRYKKYSVRNVMTRYGERKVIKFEKIDGKVEEYWVPSRLSRVLDKGLLLPAGTLLCVYEKLNNGRYVYNFYQKPSYE